MQEFETIIGSDIERAAAFLRQDELVAIPTETVYGLAANALSEKAVEKVFAAKQRPKNNPLIIHVAGIEQVKTIAFLPQVAEELFLHFSPGPLTLLLPKKEKVPSIVNAGLAEVAVRIPAHPLTLALLEKLDFPLVAPSANPFTRVSPTKAGHVYKSFRGIIPYILDGGECRVGIESTVAGFNEAGIPVIYREGSVSAADIAAVAGEVIVHSSGSSAAPGKFPKHYSPLTPVKLFPYGELPATVPQDAGVIAFSSPVPAVDEERLFILSRNGELEEAARNLYKGLHLLDEKGLSAIYAELVPDKGIGKAINNRLRKAAYSD